MIKYRADYLLRRIDKKEVAKETEKAVFLFSLLRAPRKELKNGENHAWFDTWEDAHQWLINKARLDVEKQERNLKSAVSKLDEITAMTNP